MSKTAIIKSGENYFMKQLSLNKAIVLDQVIFANISGVNGNTDVNLSGTMPTASEIAHKTAITQAGLLNDRTVVYSVILDTNIGDFSFNYIGLVNSETNTLCLVMHTDSTKKIKTVGQQQGNTITESLWLEMDKASTSTGITVNAETWQIDYSQRMAGEDERIRLSNFDLYDRLAIHDGMGITKINNQCTVTAGLAYVAGLRVNLGASKTITVANNESLYIDAWLSGTTTGEWSVNYNLIAGTNLKDYNSGIFKHYVERIASVDASGNLTVVDAKSFVTTNDLASITKIGIVKLNSSTNSDSETEAATPKAVKITYDLADGAVKKSGDTMTGQLIIANNDSSALRLKNMKGDEIMLREDADSNFIFARYDSSTSTWTNKLNFLISANKWAFENIEDVTILGKSALKQGDYGIGDIAPIVSDLNAIRQGGLYRTDGNTLNTPFSGIWGVIHVNTGGTPSSVTPSATQLAINYSAVATVYSRSATSGKWNDWIEQVNTGSINSYLPVGIPQPWPTTTAPTGWLKCNGSLFDKTLYPKLTTAYPTGRLPDLRGEFIRGLDDGRGVDSGRVILSNQGDAIRNIVGGLGVTNGRTNTNVATDGAFYITSTYQADQNGTAGRMIVCNTNFDASRVVPTANENRVRNTAFLYIVKAE